MGLACPHTHLTLTIKISFLPSASQSMNNLCLNIIRKENRNTGSELHIPSRSRCIIWNEITWIENGKELKGRGWAWVPWQAWLWCSLVLAVSLPTLVVIISFMTYTLTAHNFRSEQVQFMMVLLKSRVHLARSVARVRTSRGNFNPYIV